MTKNEQFRQMIQEIVKREVSQIVPLMVREVMAGMLMEIAVSRHENSPVLENTKKAKTLREVSYANSPAESDVYSTMKAPVDRDELAAILGYGDLVQSRRTDLISVDHAMPIADNASPIPISPNQVPEAVIKAMNTDYRAFMQSLNNSAARMRTANA